MTERLRVPWPSRNLATEKERQAAAREFAKLVRWRKEHYDEKGRCEHSRRLRVVEL